MTAASEKRWVWILFPAITMSLGWGLRGYIGGGPLGAMIPGAMVAMALCLLLGRTEDRDAAIVAAFGAVGVGFGGQETYGQTVGFSIRADTMWWGLLGLGLKGAVWGLLGGTVIGLALAREAYSRRDTLAGLALMVAGTWTGWKLVNQPKLIYFSDPVNKPREELWAGLMLGAIALLAWLWSRSKNTTPLRLALWGFAGGGFGFFFGGFLQSMGRQHAPNLMRDYWKLMEFTFGFCFGAALGECARRLDQPAPKLDRPDWPPLVGLALTVATGWLALSEVLPFEYTVAGAALLAVALYSPAAAWQIAVTITYLAFSIDFLENRPGWDARAMAMAVAAATLAIAAWILRRPGLRALFLFLTIAATGDALLKGLGPGAQRPAPAAVMAAFVALAVLTIALERRVSTRPG